MEFIDYSGRLYKESARPQVLKGKFVQIRNIAIDEEYVVLYPAGNPAANSFFHANILELFCKDRAIKGRYAGRKDLFRIYDPEYEVVGGGMFVRNYDLKLLSLYDQSGSYGPFDPAGLAERLTGIDELEGYTFKLL